MARSPSRNRAWHRFTGQPDEPSRWVGAGSRAFTRKIVERTRRGMAGRQGQDTGSSITL